MSKKGLVQRLQAENKELREQLEAKTNTPSEESTRQVIKFLTNYGNKRFEAGRVAERTNAKALVEAAASTIENYYITVTNMENQLSAIFSAAYTAERNQTALKRGLRFVAGRLIKAVKDVKEKEAELGYKFPPERYEILEYLANLVSNVATRGNCEPFWDFIGQYGNPEYAGEEFLERLRQLKPKHTRARDNKTILIGEKVEKIYSDSKGSITLQEAAYTALLELGLDPENDPDMIENAIRYRARILSDR